MLARGFWGDCKRWGGCGLGADAKRGSDRRGDTSARFGWMNGSGGERSRVALQVEVGPGLASPGLSGDCRIRGGFGAWGVMRDEG